MSKYCAIANAKEDHLITFVRIRTGPQSPANGRNHTQSLFQNRKNQYSPKIHARSPYLQIDARTNLFGQQRKDPLMQLRNRVHVLNSLEHRVIVFPQLGLDVYLAYHNLAKLHLPVFDFSHSPNSSKIYLFQVIYP